MTGPSLPILIPVGGSVLLTLDFAPPVPALVSGTLRISSDDPDEPALDIPLSGVSFLRNLAAAGVRATCHKEVERRLESLTRIHVKQWGTCFLDELRGVACDAGARDLKIGRAEERLRAGLGGDADRRCGGQGLTPSLLGLPDSCGGSCGAIEIDTLSDWADCLVCRQQVATGALLTASLGTAPPDLPASVLAADPYRCSRSVVGRMQRAITSLQKKLARCELANVTAASPADRAVTLAADVARLTGKIDAAIDRCRDTTGMEGCRFEPGADPTCLASSASAIATDLVAAVFETE